MTDNKTADFSFSKFMVLCSLCWCSLYLAQWFLSFSTGVWMNLGTVVPKQSIVFWNSVTTWIDWPHVHRIILLFLRIRKNQKKTNFALKQNFISTALFFAYFVGGDENFYLLSGISWLHANQKTIKYNLHVNSHLDTAFINLKPKYTGSNNTTQLDPTRCFKICFENTTQNQSGFCINAVKIAFMWIKMALIVIAKDE